MEDSKTATSPPQPPPLEHIEGQAIRIDVERLADRLHVRLRPPTIPPGMSAGPRVAIELDRTAAASLGAALLRHAEALGVSHG